MFKRSGWFFLVLCLSVGAYATYSISLVPLDSRPANTYSPKMIAKMAGFEITMPDSLDYYKTSGDCDKTAKWLLETEADCYVISISQLLYGGLIASRTSEVPLLVAKERLETLRELRKRSQNKPIYVFDTIQRLAITTTDYRASRYYSSVHNWAILKDEVENLGQGYKRGELEALESFIPTDIIEDYLAARERNHEINCILIDMVSEGIIDFLVLAQDDASTTGLHRAEREVLKNKAAELDVLDKVAIFPGADEVGVVLVSRGINKLLNIEPTFTVFYRGVDGNTWIAPLEDISFAENIRRHMSAAGARLSPNGDIKFFVSTPGGSNETFVQRIKKEMELGQKVVVCDVNDLNRAEPALFRTLLRNIELRNLQGFAGWNTAGNTLGLALGQGVAAVAREDLTGKEHQLATEAHIEYLLSRYAKDYYYKSLSKSSIESWAYSQGYDPFDLPKSHFSLIEEQMNDYLIANLFYFYDQHFANKEIASYRLPEEIGWDIYLVWPRFFEIAIEPKVELDVINEQITQ